MSKVKMRIPRPVQYAVYIFCLAAFCSLSFAGLLVVAERLTANSGSVRITTFVHDVSDLAFSMAIFSLFIFIQVVIAEVAIKRLSLMSMFLLSAPSTIMGQWFFFQCLLSAKESYAMVAVIGFLFFSWGLPVIILSCRNKSLTESKLDSSKNTYIGYFSLHVRRSLRYHLLVVLMISSVAVLFLFYVGAPHAPYISESYNGEGSLHHARLWKQRLLDCNSPTEVRAAFICINDDVPTGSITIDSKGPNLNVIDKAYALIYEFEKGDWIAVAYANSHGKNPAGGTVVLRDSNGIIRVYFGHVCGSPYLDGLSKEEIYAHFTEPYWREITSID